MSPRSRPRFLILCLAVLCLAPSTANAEVGGRVDLDLDLGAPMIDRDITFGIGGRFGWRFDVGPAWLQPEAGGSYTFFHCSNCPDITFFRSDLRVARMFGGLRLGGAGLVARVIEPAIFAHAGYGWLSSSLSGPSADFGFSLDVHFVRYFRFGAHAAYNVVSTSSEHDYGEIHYASKWISAGLHLGVAF
jgi:hypothetical protein